jgi:hypothetical protein
MSCCWLFALAIQAITADAGTIVRLERSHPWRPPFGLERVGQALTAVVELPAAHGLMAARLEARRSEKTIGRYPLKSDTHEPQRVAIEGVPDALVVIGENEREIARTPVSVAELEAEAVARADVVVNPVDLGTILVPADWLLLGPGQGGVVEVASLSRAAGRPGARLSAWFESAPTVRSSIGLPLPSGRRVRGRLRLPTAPHGLDRDLLHVALADDNAELWHKTIRTMLVHNAPSLPRFGATSTKLRYDAPISVRDPRNGSFSELDYEKGWGPSFSDVVVTLPNGGRFVFWRGSSYIPFWAGRSNTGICYEWAENLSRLPGAVDCVEPLMDKELRYGRVEIVESTPARVHVRWSYQSTDLVYQVWGDSAVEDYYFYPDGFGTRVVNLTADPAAEYELSELIVLTPQEAYPLDVLPRHLVELVFLDGETRPLELPPANAVALPERAVPPLYRVRSNRDEPLAAIYFSPGDTKLPTIFAPFRDQGQIVTPAYWGSHWPLARGNATGSAIDDRIHRSPAHNSLMTWAAHKPPPLTSARVATLDALGRPRTMLVRRWAWLIGMTDETDEQLRARGRSFGQPPALEARGARIDFDAYAQERRALRLVVDRPNVAIVIEPSVPCVNPAFELRGAPRGIHAVTLGDRLLNSDEYAWDGHTLWINATIAVKTELQLTFEPGGR